MVSRSTERPSAGPSSRTRSGGGLWETVKAIAYAILIALVIRSLLVEPFNIPSGSMKPTLLVGDYLFVSKYAYGYSRHSFPFGILPFDGRVWYTAPERGDVVVFKLPRDDSQDFIKRVVGLPGDSIQVIAGVLHVNGTAVDRERVADFEEAAGGAVPSRSRRYRETLPGGTSHLILETRGDDAPLDNTGVFKVPRDHFFMMGDNRDGSSDSRNPMSGVGFVPKENLVGRAEFIFFSHDGSAHWWEVWKWPFAVRFGRLLNGVG